MAQTVGFIGLGIMGKPMVKNLLKAGFDLSVHDLREEPVKELMRCGATPAASPREVGARAETVITMLPASSDVEAVATGAGGLMEGMKEGATLIDMSTIEPPVTRRIARALAARGIEMLDAPVSRGEPAAVSGTLVIMVGGKPAVYEAHLPILKAMGTDIFYCGESGMGEVVKLVNNLLIGIISCAIAEAMVFGVKAGAKLETIKQVIGASSGNSWLLQNFFADKAFRGDFEPGFMIDLMHKDLGLVLATAAQLGVPLFHGSLSREIFGLLKAKGRGKMDFTAAITLVEEAAGIKVRSSS